MVYQGEDISSITCSFAESEFQFSQFQGLQMDHNTPNDIIENPLHEFQGSSCSSHERVNSGFSHQIIPSFNNRRKGAPHRSITIKTIHINHLIYKSFHSC